MSLLKFNKIIFFIFFWWSCLTPNFLNIFSFPNFTNFIDEILQLILVVSWSIMILCSNKKIKINKSIVWLGVTFFLITIISYVYNGSGLVKLIQFLIIYLRPIFLVLLAATIFKIKDIPFIIKNVAVLFGIQLILNIAWTLGINPIPHYKIYIDINTGTFESVAPVAYFCIMIIFYLIGLLLNKNEKKKHLIILVIIVSFIQLYFTFTTHAILLGIISLSSLILINKKYIYYVISSFIILTILLTVLSSFEEDKFHSSTVELMSPENLMNDRFERIQSSIKFVSFYLVATDNIPEIRSPLLGAGPGMYGSIVASRDSKLYDKYNNVEKLQDLGLKIRDPTSVTGGAVSGYLAIMGDLGWLGFFIYMYLNIYMLVKTLKFVRSKKHNLTRYPEIFTAVIPSIVFYLILDLIWDMGAFKIMSIGLWIWVGIVLREIYLTNNFLKNLKITKVE